MNRAAPLLSAALLLLNSLILGYGQTDSRAQGRSGSQLGNTPFRFRLGLEYWIQTSYRTNLDLDSSIKDGDAFAWERIKPRLDIVSRHLELVLQGQDSRPFSSLATASNKSQLDFLKASVKIKGPAGWALKIGREQGDGEEFGVSKRLLSSTNYGTVLKAFDVASLQWNQKGLGLMGFVSSPVDNRPSQFNRRRKGEIFWGLQSDSRLGKHFLRGFFAAKSIARNILTSEAGVRGDGATYALGFQKSGPLMVPGILWDIDALVQWGHHSTDSIRAWAIYLNGRYAFSRDHSLFWGYHQASGDEKRGDGKRGVYDIFYASGYNEFGYLGLSRGANIRHIKVGGGSKLVGPLSLYWIYHDSYLVNRTDVWYANSTPNIFRPAARSSHIGQEINAYVNFRFPFAKYATISVGYLGFLPGAYLRTTGVHDPPRQFTIDVFGGF